MKMSSAESHNASTHCSCPELDQFMTHVQKSEWDRAAELPGHLDAIWTWLKQVMEKAIDDRQWDWVVHLFNKCQDVLQADRVVEELMNCNQWDRFAMVMESCCGSKVLDRVVGRAVEQGQWQWVKWAMEKNGQQWSDWLCQQAVDNGQWDLVLQLIERGVSAALRNNLLESTLGHHHVLLVAKLLHSGVSTHCREEGIRKQITAGNGGFVLEVVRKVKDPDLTDFVLRESMKESRWSLVLDLVREGLSVAHLESVCDQAVADKQWTVVFQLLLDGISPSEWMVNELFQNNKAQDLLDLFPAGGVPEGLKGLLLIGSVKFHLADFTLRIVERETFTDSEIMEALKFAVYLQDKTLFLRLISDCPRSHRVFKQKFVHHQWRESIQPFECDGGEVWWVYSVLYDNGYMKLASFVATSVKTSRRIIYDFCRCEWNRKLLDLKMFPRALTKLLEIDQKKYCWFVERSYKASRTSKSKRSFLFRHTIRLGVYGLTRKLSRHGVSRKDLKFAFNSLVKSGVSSKVFDWIIDEISGIGQGWDVSWLRQYTVKSSMKEYFKNRSDTNLEFFKDEFTEGCRQPLYRQIFKEAVRKCVELDDANCFVMLCETYGSSSPADFTDAEIKRDRGFAYAAAIGGNRPHFISKVCDDYPNCHVVLFVVNTIMKREAWHLLGCVTSALHCLSFGDKVIRLLKRCVLQMMSDQSVWLHIAAMLDQWIGGCDDLEGKNLKRAMTGMRARILSRQWAFSLPEVTRWCVDTGHANLAFFLSLVTEDWEMLTAVVTTLPSLLDLHHNLLWAVVELTDRRRKFLTCVAVLNLLSFEKYPVIGYWKRSGNLKFLRCLARTCEEQGVVHWAFILRADSSAYILKKHHLCQNPYVLAFLIEKAGKKGGWDVVRALVSKCTDSETLATALKMAVRTGQKSLAEDLFNRVDPTNPVDHNVLLTAINTNPKYMTKMISVCIYAGIPSFERQKQRIYDNCPLHETLEYPDPKIVKLLLRSGAFSHERLCNLWKDERAKEQLLDRLIEDSDDEDLEEWKACYTLINKAKATPLRLEHSARLVASHSIGCQPGRRDRISSLSVPEPIKDLLNFKDVVTMDLDREEEL